MRRTLDVGRLNKRVTFKAWTEVESDLGQSHLELTDYRTCWASLAPTRGAEYYEAQKLREQLTYKLYCRWFEGLTSDMILYYEGERYQLTSVIDIDLEHKMYEVYCTKYVDKVVS